MRRRRRPCTIAPLLKRRASTMASYRTLLLEIGDDAALESRLHTALRLARQFDAALIGLHVMPTPIIPLGYGEIAPYVGADFIEAQRRANREVSDRLRETFQRICGTEASALWQDAEGDPGQLLARAARTADLVVAAKHESLGIDVPATIEQVAMGSGVPALMLPANAHAEFGKTVVVAWDGSREATRAAHDALPFLRRAELVVLCAIGEEAGATLDAAATMLHRHDVPVQPEALEDVDGDAGRTLLAQTRAYGADLLVMGAYGHARLREMVFGGATRHVLHEARLPVLFGS
jgi:nucleotide-binding universal stress UspA family protein